MAGSTAQVSVDTSADLVAAGDPNAPTVVTVANRGSVDAYFGYEASVTTTTGYLVKAGEFKDFWLDPGESLYAVTAADSTTIHVDAARRTG